MGKNNGKARQAIDDIIWRTACCITKATDTNSEYVNILVFPQQKSLWGNRFNVTFIRARAVLVCEEGLKARFRRDCGPVIKQIT